MTDYPRRDALRAERQRQQQLHRHRTRRPLNWAVPDLTWVLEGPITSSRWMAPQRITIDPGGAGEMPQEKVIIAVDGFIETGELEVSWLDYDTGYFVEGHVVSGPSSRLVIPPFVIVEGAYGGRLIQPYLTDASVGAENGSLNLIVETRAI